MFKRTVAGSTVRYRYDLQGRAIEMCAVDVSTTVLHDYSGAFLTRVHGKAQTSTARRSVQAITNRSCSLARRAQF